MALKTGPCPSSLQQCGGGGVPRAGGEADCASSAVFSGVLCGVCALALLPAMAAVLGCMPCAVRWGGVEVWRRAARVLVAFLVGIFELGGFPSPRGSALPCEC